MIEYELYEKDEIIRPRTITKKPKTKKADHKHQYELIDRPHPWLRNTFLKIEVCKICQREGNVKRGDDSDE
jgi:hypothetical protein